jgi:hypothetical protein
MAKTRDSALQFIEAVLMDFANQTGGCVGATTVHRYAIHILDGLASGYTDQVVEAARGHRDIEYSCRQKKDGQEPADA